MIDVIEQPDAAVLREVNDYLAGASEDSGACGEHDPRWLNVLREGLKQKPYMLVARDRQGGQIRGYLPLALVASRLFGRFLVSLPYLNRAGIVAGDTDTARELIGRAVDLADEKNVKYLELRHDGLWGKRLDGAGFFHVSRGDKVRMVLELPKEEADLWKSIGPKVRNQIRKGDKNALTVRWGGLGLLADFYKVFAVNMRDLGTPVYPAKLFASIMEQFPQEAEFAVVDYQNQVVAGALLVHDARSTQVPSASCLRPFNFTNANMWMYHQLLLRAMGRGSREFDFGRSSEGSGTYRFKKQWGATPHPTVWQYHVRSGDVGSMRPDNPRNRRRVETWKKLPLWFTRLAGPMIVRGIP